MKITNIIGANNKLQLPNFNQNMPTHKVTNDHTSVNGSMLSDSIFISSDALSLLASEEKHEDTSELIAMLERLNEQSTENDSAFDDFAKCLLIAMRIINGDHVPARDKQFLAENEPEMYANAMMLQRHNVNPKKFKSLLDDKKAETTAEVPPAVSLEFTDRPIESVSAIGMSSSTEASD